jgi:hypothetical protein
MVRLNVRELNAELRNLRRGAVQDRATESPSVRLLKTLLSNLSESDDRFVVYGLLRGELHLDGNFEAALECARAALTEFDDITSRCILARELLETGRSVEAVREFQIAFLLAAETNTLVNYVFGEFMRAAVGIGDIELIETTSEEFLGLKCVESREDCRFETDWLDEARALGVHENIIKGLCSHAESR